MIKHYQMLKVMYIWVKMKMKIKVRLLEIIAN